MGEPAGVERHWADRAAEQILEREPSAPVVQTGISPSGPFHIGHLREILTGDALTRALRERGADARHLFVVDNLDPLRKVYPFLDEQVYGPLVGRSLCELPAPEGEGTYDEAFLGPFLHALRRLGVDAEVVRASELYASGRMDEVVLEALAQRDRLAGILEQVTGKSVEHDWSPWNPRCPSCRRIDRGEVLGFDRGAGTVRSRCRACGETAEQPVAGGGKLTWRVDWPARWKAQRVTAEPFGKDHASRGGSWDSGVRIAREVFAIEPPVEAVYEWIGLRGRGDMSSSKGNVLTVSELLEVVPPEVLRYFVLKARPGRSITFDPGLPLLRLVDEVDDASARGRDDGALQLSRVAGFRPVGVPFHHLVLVGQLAGFETDRVVELLERGGYRDLDREAIEARLALARGWLERFAPDEARVEIARTLPDSARDLEPDQRAFLAALARELPALDGAPGDVIHEKIYALATAEGAPGARRAFEAIYRALLGRERGPRAASLIEVWGVRRAAARFAEAAGGGASG